MVADPDATESALVALVAEAESLVGPHRARLDPTAALGVGAHVTVLYPFVHPGAVDADVVDRLQRVVGDVAAFDCTFDEVGWFGDDFVWLAPDPRAPFDDLTARVTAAFPEHPPYAGEHAPRPHLTLGYRRHAGLDALREAAAAVSSAPPVPARVERLQLLAGRRAAGSWRTLAEVALRG